MEQLAAELDEKATVKKKKSFTLKRYKLMKTKTKEDVFSDSSPKVPPFIYLSIYLSIFYYLFIYLCSSFFFKKKPSIESCIWT